ncbi:phytanoyl-CoA dioxygenase family protein [Maritalea sp.]|uniref:phytanoyl-CoA dioxygenase family protein n=1 Tax=Maritalea sp. TaxID=2003361 RepID=UPI003EF858C2
MHDTNVKDSHASYKGSTALHKIKKKLDLRVLSQEDWKHWTTKGYVIVRQAVPQANVERLVDLLWEFDEKDPNDPSTWYAPQRREHKMKELNNAGMLEIYNHQYLWDNRMEKRIYDVFVDIWDREDLWVVIDRANLNPPKKVKGNPNGFIHWDVDTSLDPLPISVQAVLSLKKQDSETGGFQCVPYLFEHFDEWKKTQPEDRDPKHPDMTGIDIDNISLEPGDLLIFNALLAHGVRPNHSDDKVRMAQYISMYPADFDNVEEREERVRLWKEQECPKRDSFPGDPRDWEKKNSERAVLNEHGEKLLGLRRW